MKSGIVKRSIIIIVLTERPIGWFALPNVDGLRRIALRLSELIAEPV